MVAVFSGRQPRTSLPALILVLLSISSVAVSGLSLQERVPAIISSTVSQANRGSGEIVAAIDSIESQKGPTGSTPVNCSMQGIDSASCKLATGAQPSTTSGSGSWTLISSSPNSRGLSTMAYDAADGYVVLFGGLTIGAVAINQGDTWKFQAGTWTNITPSQSPPARVAASMVYDAADHYLVLFGGINLTSATSSLSGNLLHDTWTFAGGVWSNITLAQGPSARAAYSMTYNAASSSVVLFGGTTSVKPPVEAGDTWKFSSGSWTNITSSVGTGPSARAGASMAFDAVDGYVVLFGGNSTSGLLSDTWKLSGTWSQSPARFPAGRSFAAMEYDAADKYVVMFGGASAAGVQRDTLKFLADAWTNISSSGGPSAEQGSSMTYDSADGYILLFGGFSRSSLSGTSWKFNAGSWTNITPANPSPPARIEATMAYDAADGYVVLFGGLSISSFTSVNDTWEFSQGTWTNITMPGPSIRYDSAMAYDAADGYILLYGGIGLGASGFHIPTDTWKFSGGTWTNITATAGQSPGPRLGPSMAFDEADHYIVLFGGAVFGGFASDTWKFSGGAWSSLTITGGPLGRYNAAMTYDQADKYILLFGGNTSTTATVGDTWKFSAGLWTDITPTSGPSAREFSAMTFDGADGFVVLFGGSTGSNGFLSDTWDFFGGVWTNITSPGPLGVSSTMTYDAIDGYMVLATLGFTGSGIVEQAWKFSSAPPGFDYSLSAGGPVSISPGSSGDVTITATLTGGGTRQVTLRCVIASLPSGITCGGFTVNPATPSTTGTPSVLTVNVDASVAPGSYTFMVTGSPPGATVSRATTTVSVIVKDITSTTVSDVSCAIPLGGTMCTASVIAYVYDTTTPTSAPTGTARFTLTAGSTGGSLSSQTCVLRTPYGYGNTYCSVTFTGTSAGLGSVTATYSGDSGHGSSTSPAGSVTVSVASKDSTSTSINCSPSTIVPTGTSTCVVTVADTTTASHTPGGSVSLTSTYPLIGAVDAGCTLASGTCSVTLTGVAEGSVAVGGVYSGDSTHNGSTGSSNSVVVVKDGTSITVGNVSCNIPSGSTTCTAAVTAAVMDVTSASNTPTGTVTFTLTAGSTGGSLSSNTCTLSFSRSCSVTYTGAKAGSGSITTTYEGDHTHKTSTSSAATVTVTVTSTPEQTHGAPATILGLAQTLFFGIIGAILAVIIAVALIVVRQRRRTKPSIP